MLFSLMRVWRFNTGNTTLHLESLKCCASGVDLPCLGGRTSKKKKRGVQENGGRRVSEILWGNKPWLSKTNRAGFATFSTGWEGGRRKINDNSLTGLGKKELLMIGDDKYNQFEGKWKNEKKVKGAASKQGQRSDRKSDMFLRNLSSVGPVVHRVAPGQV